MALSAFKPGPIRESAIICCALRFVEQRRFAKAELTRSIQVKKCQPLEGLAKGCDFDFVLGVIHGYRYHNYIIDNKKALYLYRALKSGQKESNT